MNYSIYTILEKANCENRNQVRGCQHWGRREGTDSKISWEIFLGGEGYFISWLWQWSHDYTFVKTHWTAHLKRVDFTACKVCLNKPDSPDKNTVQPNVRHYPPGIIYATFHRNSEIPVMYDICKKKTKKTIWKRPNMLRKMFVVGLSVFWKAHFSSPANACVGGSRSHCGTAGHVDYVEIFLVTACSFVSF